MGEQSRQSPADTQQQARGGEQPQGNEAKEMQRGKRKIPHESGDRNANESMREEGFEHAPEKPRP